MPEIPQEEDGLLVSIATEGGVVNTSGQPVEVVLIVDIANVMGSRRTAGGATGRLQPLACSMCWSL